MLSARWVFESPIDRDRLFRGSFRRFDAAVVAAPVSPTRRGSSTSSHPGQVHSTGIYTTDEFVLCSSVLSLPPFTHSLSFSPCFSCSSSGVPCYLVGTLIRLTPPTRFIKDACVGKVDELPTWSGWLLLASTPSTVEGCWSLLRCFRLSAPLAEIRHLDRCDTEECEVIARIVAPILARDRWGVLLCKRRLLLLVQGPVSDFVAGRNLSWVFPSYFPSHFNDGKEVCVSVNERWSAAFLTGGCQSMIRP